MEYISVFSHLLLWSAVSKLFLVSLSTIYRSGFRSYQGKGNLMIFLSEVSAALECRGWDTLISVFGHHCNWYCLQTIVQERALFSCQVGGRRGGLTEALQNEKNAHRTQEFFKVSVLFLQACQPALQCLFSACAIYPRIYKLS